MATRIGGGRKPHLYITEHMEAKKVSNADIARRLDIHRSTVGKWIEKGTQISVHELEQLAYAMDFDSWRRFLRPPGRESVDELIDDAPEYDRETVLHLARRLKAGRG